MPHTQRFRQHGGYSRHRLWICACCVNFVVTHYVRRLDVGAHGVQLVLRDLCTNRRQGALIVVSY